MGDIPIDSGDEDLPIFEEEEVQPNNPSIIQEEEEGPRDHIQPVVILNTRRRPNWLKATLEDAEGHGDVKETFRESKRTNIYYGYAAYMKILLK